MHWCGIAKLNWLEVVMWYKAFCLTHTHRELINYRFENHWLWRSSISCCGQCFEVFSPVFYFLISHFNRPCIIDEVVIFELYIWHKLVYYDNVVVIPFSKRRSHTRAARRDEKRLRVCVMIC